ncbi:DUF3290 family protein [uncultured Veillonella sp.]|uniref:DUF3290 family protein n=1 Tax=uncultured Veillonella sp. TaxID=159268 RepID=UPI00260E274C|nr:DUF3290 family protein [uncultured Veillonella sp.]
MDFYTYEYIVHQGQFNAVVQYGFSFLLLLALLGASVQFLRHRLNSKYRDLTILLTLVILFFLGLRWNEYDSSLRNSEGLTRMASFLTSASERLGTPKEELRVNSLQLSDNIIVNANNRFYEVRFTKNFEAYSLLQVHMVNDKIRVIDFSEE